MKKRVILLSGIPGSGKSYYVKQYIDRFKPTTVKICSADHWFERSGKYQFNPKELPSAHNECFSNFLSAMVNNIEVIFIDNTNILREHRKRYIEKAHEYGYDVYIQAFPSDVELSAQRNVHNVPKESLQRMANQFDLDPGHYFVNPNMSMEQVPDPLTQASDVVSEYTVALYAGLSDPNLIFQEAAPSKKKKPMKEPSFVYDERAARIELDAVLRQLAAKAQQNGNLTQVELNAKLDVPAVYSSGPLKSLNGVSVIGSINRLWTQVPGVPTPQNTVKRFTIDKVVYITQPIALESSKIPTVIDDIINLYNSYILRQKDIELADQIISMIRKKQEA